MSDDKNIPPELLLPSLDSESGPMPNLSEPAAQALTWRVVERWSTAREAVESGQAAGGPAAPLSDAAARDLVSATLRRHARRQSWRTLAAAGVVLSATGIAFGALRVWGPLEEQAPPTAAESIAAKSPKRTPRPLPAPIVEPPSPAPENEAPAESTPAESAPAESAPVEKAPVVPPPAPEMLAASPANANAPKTSFELSLERANALRAARAWEPARRLYMRVAMESEQPRERYVASVAAAALYLQHAGDAQRALNLYRAALRAWPAGDLSEEIRLGIAHALKALERADEEAAALRAFIAQHPQSAERVQAEQRLEALGDVGH